MDARPMCPTCGSDDPNNPHYLSLLTDDDYHICRDSWHSYDNGEVRLYQPPKEDIVVNNELGDYLPPVDLLDLPHVMNCLCYRDKPAAMGGPPDGGQDPRCMALRARINKAVRSAFARLHHDDLEEAKEEIEKMVETIKPTPAER
jgi:hypothetical protein